MSGLAQGRVNPARDAARAAKRARRAPRRSREHEGLRVLHAALSGSQSGWWEARAFVRLHGFYDGDLSGEALLAEVARIALDLPSSPPPALTKKAR